MLGRLADDVGHHGIRLYPARDSGVVRDVIVAAGDEALLAHAHPTVEAAGTAARVELDEADGPDR
ncbi:hypothetical protein [Rhodococcus sp. DMU1]|uniref:hypothetical protein n=1 Tax=Rhodococcus sp. DMU1 TaxID=2722825 RepID=UPI00143EA214|nr:hypothetical protein [Rhodococcus sp. DMU1]QIX50499.1 hypothetical protein HFP48_13690 [Rhodococcus sp. DMU1]